MPHRAVVNFLTSMQREPGVTAADTLVAVTTLSFDISVLEVFLPLVTGGRVVLASRETAQDGMRLGALMAESGATVMQATPATWRLLLEAGWPGDRQLKVLCGGEALPPSLAADLVPRVGELWNMYGPTETTVWSTCVRLDAADARITIGRPIANTQAHVLDRYKQPVPLGVVGELYLGGAGVARGYLNRPELTAERFIEDPFAAEPGARLYRTGDLARYLPDGTLDFLGRADHQVNLRGFRIELGEIEAVLCEHDAIDQAVVLARGAGADAGLVAYTVVADQREITVSEIRHFARHRLPDYMVPGLIVELNELPLTPNGKIDRKALPDPLASVAQLRPEYAPPETDTERVISAVWCELLDVERVGRHDNFFELGGHSILSLHAVAAIERQTGNRLDPRLMFFHTVEHLANALDNGANSA